MRLAPITGAVLLLAGCASPRWREADAGLARASQPSRREGFQPKSGPYNTFGSFADSLHAPWTIALDSSVEYVVGAACTAGCERMDIKVLAPGGATSLPLHADSTAASASIVRLTARETGVFTAQFVARCAAGARCWWVAQVYQKGASGRLVPAMDAGKRAHR